MIILINARPPKKLTKHHTTRSEARFTGSDGAPGVFGHSLRESGSLSNGTRITASAHPQATTHCSSDLVDLSLTNQPTVQQTFVASYRGALAHGKSDVRGLRKKASQKETIITG